MSLDFSGTTHKIDFGTGSSLDNLTPFFAFAWVYLDSNAAPDGGRVYQKGLTSNAQFFSPANPLSVEMTTARGTANCSVVALTSNFAAFGTGKWLFVAVINDTTTSGNNKIYVGDLVTLAAEPSAYITQTAGSGTQGNNNGAPAIVGNRANDNRAIDGKIAYVGIWGGVVPSDNQIHQLQFRPMPTSGCKLFAIPGYNGTGTQPDFSGNGHAGTVTSAAVADHVPIVFRRYGQLYVPYAAAAGGSTFTITPAGVLVPTGALVRDTSKVYLGGATPSGFLGKSSNTTWAGSVTPAGAEVRDTSKNVAGSAGSAGSLIRGAQSTLNGFLDPTGAIARLADKAIGGTVTLAGSISHAIAVVVSGVITPIGTLAKDISVFFAGGLTPTGSLSTIRAVLVTFAGAIGLSGAITRLTDKGAGGVVAPSGVIGFDIAAVLRGSITPLGSLGKLTSKFWSGVVGLAGTLAQIVGLVSPPSVLDITGSYIPVLSMTGSYQPALTVTGNYQPALTITGAYDT